MSTAVLGALYYGLLTPIAALVRLVRDPLHRGFDPAAESYWHVPTDARHPRWREGGSR